jgi:hypothetical protein
MSWELHEGDREYEGVASRGTGPPKFANGSPVIRLSPARCRGKFAP